MLDGAATIAPKRFVSILAFMARVLRLTLVRVRLDFPEHSATLRSALPDAVKEPVMVRTVHVYVILDGRERYATSQFAGPNVYKEFVLSPRNTIEPH